jgi:hypothetical protein
VADQLAHGQRVAQRAVPQRVQAAPVERAAERHLHQPGDLAARELAQVHALAQLVLPQREHRVGRGGVADHRDDRERLAGGHELVHQRRRRIVQELRVVGAEHEPAAGRPRRQLAPDPGEQLDAGARRHQAGERAERNRGRRPRRARPLDRAAALCRQLGYGGRQARLAHPRRARDHHAARGPVRQQRTGALELRVTADEWPPHARSLTDSRVASGV